MKYLAHDAINGDYESFEKIEDAREWLEESFLVDGEYHPDLETCEIYELKEKVDYKTTHKKSDYKTDEEWGEVCGTFDLSEMGVHKFIPVDLQRKEGFVQGAKWCRQQYER